MEAAAGLCVSRSHYEVTVEHALLKMIEYPEHDVQIILHHYGVDPSRVQKVLQVAIEKFKSGNAGKPVFSPMLIDWMKDSWLLSSIELNLAKIRSGSMLATLVHNPYRYSQGDYVEMFERIHKDELRTSFFNITNGSKEEQTAVDSGDGSALSGVRQPSGDGALAKFCINFTQRASAGEIDPVFARDREIRQMVDILGRRRKNNPILVGEAGVGKTAVVEGLALKIIEGDVPDLLKNVELYGLDMGLLQAGASVKGEFENRLKSVIAELKSSTKPIVLFIDEAHTLIGAGGPAGGGDAANLLKPALARGELRTVAATTWSEYKKYFEKDPALARRFQLVKIEEPSVDEAVVIMRGLREKYEQAHDIYIRDDAIASSASYAARYISGRQLPDKSVDLLDTACARVKISLSSKPEDMDTREREIKTLLRERDAIQRDMDTGAREDDGRVAELNAEIEVIRSAVSLMEEKWQQEKAVVEEILAIRENLKQADGEQRAPLLTQVRELEQKLASVQGDEALVHFEVRPETISRVVSDWTGIPVGSMIKDEAKAILDFGSNLKKRIKGQDHAVYALEEGIKASKAGLGNPNTPIGVFLFVGPSGVGKTESAIGLADNLFGGERFLVSINMSEFQEKHTVSRLIGSPPGYVGYGEGGVLTEAVRQRPYSVVLLDEVEKADLEVMNLFYQVFDKGSLSDGEGREIDFKNTVIILTSNLASEIISQMSIDDDRPELDELSAAIRPVLSQHFKPALLARMQVVPFYPIAKDAMQEIVVLKMNSLARRLQANQDLKLAYEQNVVDQIAQRCTEVETGARNIDHIINRNLLPKLSTEILTMLGSEETAQTINLTIDDKGDFGFSFS